MQSWPILAMDLVDNKLLMPKLHQVDILMHVLLLIFIKLNYSIVVSIAIQKPILMHGIKMVCSSWLDVSALSSSILVPNFPKYPESWLIGSSLKRKTFYPRLKKVLILSLYSIFWITSNLESPILIEHKLVVLMKQTSWINVISCLISVIILIRL